MAAAQFIVLMLFVALAPPLALLHFRPGSWLHWAASSYACLSWELLLWRALPWSSLSEYLRHPLLAFTLFAVAWSARELRGARMEKKRKRLSYWLGLAALLASGSIFLAVLVSSWRTDAQGELSVRLAWPVAHPGSFVMQGGNSALLNHHVEVAGQRRALDVVALDRFGRRSAHPLASEPALDDYAVYGAEVRSPCMGQVLATRAGEPDRAVASAAVERKIAGNFVLIYCSALDATVLLAHLQERLLVASGDALRAGAAIGHVGNSGNSSEPHLHIHALPGRVERVEEMIGTGRQGIAMRFDDRGPLHRGERGPVMGLAR